MKKIFNAKNLMIFVFLTFIGSIIFTIVRIILAPIVAPSSDVTVRVKSDYILMLVQSILGAVAMQIPGLLRRRVRLNIPTVMMTIYAIFLYCAIYLGEVQNFYYSVPHWDTTIHMFSGVALGALGFSVVSLLNKSESITFSLSPAFVAIFAFCFAVSVGVVWEIYEFSMDYFLHTNMLKFALESGELLVGLSAVTDTMKDLIVDVIGAFAISLVGYISLKHNKGWMERVRVRQL